VTLENCSQPRWKKSIWSNGYSYNISAINTSTNNVAATVNGLYGPYGIAVTPDGKRYTLLI
jgi:YVTN family beta-propeller protein